MPAVDPIPPTAWSDQLLQNPHAVADKRRRVQRMFAAIAPSYDLNNRLHSLWMDQAWRRQAVKLANLKPTDRVVDVACGTGDLAFIFSDSLWHLNGRKTSAVPKVVGIDFTFPMLGVAARKSVGYLVHAGTGVTISPFVNDETCALNLWVNGDAQSLPLPDACCDVVSIAF